MQPRLPFLSAAALAACVFISACDQRPADPALLPATDINWSTVLELGNREGLANSLWASSSEDVYVGHVDFTGDGTGGVVAHYDGTTWTTLPVSFREQWVASSVWGSGPDDVYVATGHLYHLDGGSWNLLPVDAENVTGSGPGEVFVSSGGTILEFTGVEWDTLATNDSTRVVSLVATPDGSLFAGYEGDRFDLWTGSTWIDTGWPGCGYEICAFSASEAYAIRRCGPDEVYRWDGVTWTAQPTEPASLYGIGGTPGGPLFAVGSRGDILKYETGEWQLQPRITAQWLSQVCGTPTGVAMAGDYGKVLWLDPAGTRTLRESSARFVDGLYADSASRIVLWEREAIYRYDSGNLREIPPPEPLAIVDVDATSLDDIYALVGYEQLAHFNGTTWDQIESIPTQAYFLYVTPGGTPFVLGAEGGVLRRETTWETILAASDNFYPQVIIGDGEDGIIISGIDVAAEKSVVMRFNGSAWQTLGSLDTGVGAMWCGSNLDLVVAGFAGIYQFENGRFHRLPGPRRGHTSVITRAGDGRIVAMNPREIAVFDGAFVNVSEFDGPIVATRARDGSIVAQVGRRLVAWRP